MSCSVPSSDFSHHSGTSSSWFNQILIQPSCSWALPVVCTLLWIVCIYIHEGICWLLASLVIGVPPRECSWLGWMLWENFFFTIIHFSYGLPGILMLLILSVDSVFLRVNHIVDLVTANVFTISLIGLFSFLSLMMAFLLNLRRISFGLHIESSSEQLPNAYLTSEINPRHLIWLI